jgi:cell division septum initiation protein DivIVA
MARSEVGESGSGHVKDAGISPEVESEAADVVGRTMDDERPARRFGSSRVLTAADRDRILKEARTVGFPVALRGYDRAAVERYVERMSRLITELEMSSSPEAAVRHALDEVSDETRDILQRAHDTAEEITARSRARADDRLDTVERESRELREAAERQADELRETAAREVAELRQTAAREVAEVRETAKRETEQLRNSTQRETDEMRGGARRDAEEMIESAQRRARELARSAETVWRERRRLIEDMLAVGEQLVAIGEAEGKRFPRFGEEGSDVAELLHEREPAPTLAGRMHDAGRVEEQAKGSPEAVPG